MKMFLYVFQNKVSGRKYYGITSNIKRRMASHKHASKTKKTPFYDAVRKYGWEGFEFTIMEEGTKESIAQKEIDLIANDPDCYNLHLGGHTGFDVRQSPKLEEWKQKLRTARIGRTPTLGMQHTTETKELCGLHGKARWDKYGRYPSEVLDYGFAESNRKFGISRTHYYRLRKAAQE